MKTQIKDTTYGMSVTITDVKFSKGKFAEIKKKLDQYHKKDPNVDQSNERAEESFIEFVTWCFDISSKSNIEEAFKGNEALLEKLYKVFMKRMDFESNDSCKFYLHDYKSRKEVIDNYIVEVKSYLDVITNSSSELFVIESDKTSQELQKLLEALPLKEDDYFSGEAGTLEVSKVSVITHLWEYLYGYWEEPVVMEKIHEDFTDEELHVMDQILTQQYGYDKDAKLYFVSVDYGFKSIREFVKNTLKGQSI